MLRNFKDLRFSERGRYSDFRQLPILSCQHYSLMRSFQHLQSLEYMSKNWYLSIRYSRYIKIQLDSEHRGHKQTKWIYMVIQIPLFVSSWPRCQAEFFKYIERSMGYGSKGEFHCNCRMTNLLTREKNHLLLKRTLKYLVLQEYKKGRFYQRRFHDMGGLRSWW